MTLISLFVTTFFFAYRVRNLLFGKSPEKNELIFALIFNALIGTGPRMYI